MHPVSKSRASFPPISRQTLRNNSSQFLRLARSDTCYNEQGFGLHKGALGMCCVYGMVGYLVAFLSSVLLVIIALLLIMQWIVHPMVPYFTSLWFHPAVSLYRACLVRSFSWCCCWPSFAVSGISSICHSQCRGGCTSWCECKRILGRSSSENFFWCTGFQSYCFR